MKRYDVVVIGSGPAGQQAAIAAAKAGAAAAVVERDAKVGGACLHRGTIPSKTLREAALRLCRLQRDAHRVGMQLPEQLRVDMLTDHLRGVIGAQVATISDALGEHGVVREHGVARVASQHEVEVVRPGGARERIEAGTIVIATGSRPRKPPELPIDHEFILDSDSVLSLEYLPDSIAIPGGGVIACEYASIFAVLGVKVTLIDRADRPLGFLDEDLSHAYVEAFEAMGGTYLSRATITGAEADGLCTVATTLEDGRVIETERMMVALGRVPNVERLDLESVGVELDKRGRVVVDDHCQTACPSVYAVGDVIGAPALASTSMEQGRRAVHHALGLTTPRAWDVIPIGIYTIPEIAAVGMTEAQAREEHGDVVIGTAAFKNVARGQISGEGHGMLKLIASPDGERILGVGIVGEGAAELVGLGQMAMLLDGRVRDFVENIFNFPTMAEAYRLAALEVGASAAVRTGRAA